LSEEAVHEQQVFARRVLCSSCWVLGVDYHLGSCGGYTGYLALEFGALAARDRKARLILPGCDLSVLATRVAGLVTQIALAGLDSASGQAAALRALIALL